MEFEKPSEAKWTLFRVCQDLIEEFDLHVNDGPVNLMPIVEKRNIGLEIIPLPESSHGFAIFDLVNGVPPQICLNSLDAKNIQNEKLGHEIIHLQKHFYERMQFCWDAQASPKEELEADQGAALLKVPLSFMTEMVKQGETTEIIAAELEVRKELVEMRWQLAVELKELGPEFNFALNKILPGKSFSVPVYSGNEIEIFAKAVPKEKRKSLFPETEILSIGLVEQNYIPIEDLVSPELRTLVLKALEEESMGQSLF